MKYKRIFMLPIDGFAHWNDIYQKITSTFDVPGTTEIISHIKLNDVVYGPEGCHTMRKVKELLKKMKLDENIKIFLDLKLSDTSGTNANILKQYLNQGLIPDVITVRECCSIETFKKIRELMPTTKIALVSVLTDTDRDECVSRYGMEPVKKIIDDIEGILELYPDALDAVVCSPFEIKEIKESFPNLLSISPGIRDNWMESGQQKRFLGIREAIEFNGDLFVVGSQLTKGNPKKGISPHDSIIKTMHEMSLAKVITSDPLETLKNFNAVYVSKKDSEGNFIGPLAGYAGKDKTGKNYVGFAYYNLAQVEHEPRLLDHFANILVDKINDQIPDIDVVLGAPMGGLALAQSVAAKLNCRYAFAEKVVIKLPNPKTGEKGESELKINRHEIHPGEKVLVIEDLCNNFSTTLKLRNLINIDKKAQTVAVACIVNRSFPKTIKSWRKLPVISVLNLPTEQFKQDDEKVAKHIKNKNIVWKPKYDWPRLKEAMV